ncbi:asparagine synthase (glutamine-hydrolyzing) [bacterium]|nr:asparagine synthase (glutamine-hydrolyzing) [bacterium]
MCGIVGVVAKFGQRPSVSSEQLIAMRDVMVARGPDDCGSFERDNVAFGHRRLAIRDRQGGEQPWVSDDGNCVLVYNGELYNDAELRRELEKFGHRFRTHCDTETLMAAWRQWGVDSLLRLAGMFAFAVYDFTRQRLTLVRDRFGIKPLFIASLGEELAFASSAAALLKHPRISREPNWRAVNHYLTTFRITLGHETMFRDIQQLRPAELLTWDLRSDQVSVDRYWEFPRRRSTCVGSTARSPSFETASERFAELLSDVTEQHLVSDVPVGMFLSGGVDSNTLATIVAERHSAGMLGACGGGASEVGTSDVLRELDDFDFAAECARHAGFEFDEVRVTADDYFESWGVLLSESGLPLPTPSDGIIHRLAQRMKQAVGVVLGGEGADELLCGYTRPHWSIEDFRLAQLAANGNWPGTDEQQQSFLQILQATYGRTQFAGPVDHYFAANSLIPAAARQALLTSDVWAASEGDESIAAFYTAEFADAAAIVGESNSVSTLAQQAVLLHRLNLESLLGRLDTATMAASLEARVPYADHRLVEFVFQLPVEFSIDVRPEATTSLLPAAELDIRGDLRSKRLLREIAARRLPHDLAWRPKASFPTPVANWLAGPWQQWAAETLHTSPFAREVFRPEALDELAGNVPAVGMWLWPILNLIRWSDEFA